MKHLKRYYAGVAVTALCVMTSCAKEDAGSRATHDGFLTEKDGAVHLLSDVEAETYCEDHYCEPNYLYSINMGGKKPTEPAPVPTPVEPPPIPGGPGQRDPNQPRDPGPVPTSAQVLDYSRTIMRVDRAWDLTDGDPTVIVAVVDTGVDVSNHDLMNNIWTNEAEKNGQPGVDDDQNGFVDDVYGYDFTRDKGNGLDDNGHGTHVAGIIAAEYNAFGAVGVAPRVKIMPLKFLSASGSGDSNNAIKAIRYAMNNGAHIISNSWGGEGASTLLNQVIQEAIQRGIYFVAAAGNDHRSNVSRPTYPAVYPNVLSVGSTDQSDRKSTFSNFGSNVTIAAPGTSIYSTLRNDKFGTMSGTSMATPQISGVLALGLSLNRGLDRREMETRLCNTAKKILTSDFRCGRVDARAFLEDLLR